MSARRALLAFGRSLPVAALLVGLVGLFRLGRQFPAAAASPSLLVPFLKPVAALALEAGALIALSASLLPLLLRLRRESLAARARAGAPLLGLLAVTLAAAAVMPRGTQRPGLLANDLILHALAGCGGSVTSVPIPLLGLNVRCGDTPRIEGPMPGVSAVTLVMRELTFSDDLRRVTISGLELTAKRALNLHLTASTARIAGLAPWTRSSRLSAWAHFLVLAAVGASFWLAATLAWRWETRVKGEADGAALAKAPTLRRLGQTLLCAAPGVVMAALAIALDQQGAAPSRYAAAAVAGVAALLGLRLLAWRAPKWFSSFSNF